MKILEMTSQGKLEQTVEIDSGWKINLAGFLWVKPHNCRIIRNPVNKMNKKLFKFLKNNILKTFTLKVSKGRMFV